MSGLEHIESVVVVYQAAKLDAFEAKCSGRLTGRSRQERSGCCRPRPVPLSC